MILTKCSLRSNAGIRIGGSASVIVPAGIYAAGTISVSGEGSANLSPQFQNSGQIADPYASNQALQTAFDKLVPGGGQAQPQTLVLSPGDYSSLDFHGPVHLNPGLYVVDGPVSFGAGALVTGTGVTVVSSRSVKMGGHAVVALSAPDANATGGSVPGILYANNGVDQELQWSGTASENLTGVVYTPNSSMKLTGSAVTIESSAGTGGSACFEVIASTVTIAGNANLAGDCVSLGASSFGTSPGAVALVQ